MQTIKRSARKDRTAKAFVRPQPSSRGDTTPGNVAIRTIGLQVLIFLIAFAIVYLRRPDALTNAQFYAEDGAVWYPQAYQFGVRSFLIPVAGYLHALIRSAALFSLLFPFSQAPLVMNLCAIVVQILPVNVFLSSRFSRISFRMRLLGAFLYMALPNSYEIHANITNVQWHLVLLACLLLLARPAEGMAWKIFDGAVLILTPLSSPIGILLVPVAAVLWWRDRAPQRAAAAAFLIPGAVIEGITILFHLHTRQLGNLAAGGLVSSENGATIARLVHILGRQIFLASLVGLNTQNMFSEASFIGIAAAAVGLTVLAYALWRGPVEIKLFILFALTALAVALISPLAGPPDLPQWEWLCQGAGNRYYFLPMLAFLASLFWLIGYPRAPQNLRYLGLILLLLLPVGIFQDWQFPAFRDYQFQRYADQFDRARSGDKLTIPINPGLSMNIIKR